MANYKEEIVQGTLTKYIRCSEGYFKNSDVRDSSKKPHIVFYENEVSNLPDGNIYEKQNISSVVTELVDPAKTFNLLNPTTDEIVGTMTYGEVFMCMYSLYRFASVERDQLEVERLAAEAALASQPPANYFNPAIEPIASPVVDPVLTPDPTIIPTETLTPPVIDPAAAPILDPVVAPADPNAPVTPAVDPNTAAPTDPNAPVTPAVDPNAAAPAV